MQTIGYRIGTWVFGSAALCTLVALPVAYSRCGECAGHPDFENNWVPESTPVSIALLDWPMGFRLLLMAFVASALCFGAAAMWRIARTFHKRRPRLATTIQAVLSSLVVGLLNIVGAYASGYVGYIGPANGLWMIGIPTAVALMNAPNKWAIFSIVPLLIGGWFATAIIAMIFYIPLD